MLEYRLRLRMLSFILSVCCTLAESETLKLVINQRLLSRMRKGAEYGMFHPDPVCNVVIVDVPESPWIFPDYGPIGIHKTYVHTFKYLYKSSFKIVVHLRVAYID